jgi:formylglycine-generating enzyme
MQERYFYATLLLLLILITACTKDNDITNNDDDDNNEIPGMVLIEAINAGFQMGSDAGFADESPVHNVEITHDFWMDDSEVTQSEYDDLMAASYAGYHTPTWNESYGHGDNYPAYEVEWGDAVLYCNAKSRAEGRDSVYTYTSIIGTPGYLCELENVSADFAKNGYRLPTEAEWEFAYRGNSDTDFYWEQDYDPYPANAADSTEFDEYAVWHGNSEIFGIDDNVYGTHPVKSKQPNLYGLYDMAGNMFEWCHDWYGAYSANSQEDPVGPDTGDWHAIRGGSWANHANYLRATNRTFVAPCYYYYLLGFRTVLTKLD